jgi:hypothetical protein
VRVVVVRPCVVVPAGRRVVLVRVVVVPPLVRCVGVRVVVVRLVVRPLLELDELELELDDFLAAALWVRLPPERELTIEPNANASLCSAPITVGSASANATANTVNFVISRFIASSPLLRAR